MGAVPGQHGDADGGGQAVSVGRARLPGARGPVQQAVPADRPDQPLGDLHGALDTGVRQQHEELLPAVPAERVRAADLHAQALDEVAQHGVPPAPAVLGRDRLEARDLQHQQGQRVRLVEAVGALVRAAGALDLPAEAELEVPVVPRAGERVAGGGALQLRAAVLQLGDPAALGRLADGGAGCDPPQPDPEQGGAGECGGTQHG